MPGYTQLPILTCMRPIEQPKHINPVNQLKRAPKHVIAHEYYV